MTSNCEDLDQCFRLNAAFSPAGDQSQSIDTIVKNCVDQRHNQVLLGVTGSGKTFVMANVIAQLQRPALVMAPNKILAAQLYSEMKSFFPENAVEYFVSYYDYYQPEAYIPRTDTFIEKDASINDQLDRMRHSATRAVLERKDVVVVASVSCLFGLGDVESYVGMALKMYVGKKDVSLDFFLKLLIGLQYDRKNLYITRGTFRVRGDYVDIFPSHYEDRGWRISFFEDEIQKITEFDVLTGKIYLNLSHVMLYPNSHHATPRPAISQALVFIKQELKERLQELRNQQKYVEAQRLEQRVTFDIEMLSTTGHCKGIENYSRYLTGRKEGEPPPTLLEYFAKDAILFVDESHNSVPQIRGMFRGDQARKTLLQEYGFRLPSCVDNRPLTFEEWDAMRPQTIFLSATPGEFELNIVEGEVIEMLVRPTGLIDPQCFMRPTANQVEDLMNEIRKVLEKKGRVLVTTLTKKMAEQLTEYFVENRIQARYMHSDTDTLERIALIHDLRQGMYDVLIGINLLREGLDIPECQMVAILDADKEGFLRSKTSLVQTIGRAARHVEGYVVLYADRLTKSLEYALSETQRRRETQSAYNVLHGIHPKSTQRSLEAKIEEGREAFDKKELTVGCVEEENLFQEFMKKGEKFFLKQLQKMKKEMQKHAENNDFEEAIFLRDRIKRLEQRILELPLI